MGLFGNPRVTVRSTAKPKARHKGKPSMITATSYKGKRAKKGNGTDLGDSDMWLNMGMRGR